MQHNDKSVSLNDVRLSLLNLAQELTANLLKIKDVLDKMVNAQLQYNSQLRSQRNHAGLFITGNNDPNTLRGLDNVIKRNNELSKQLEALQVHSLFRDDSKKLKEISKFSFEGQKELLKHLMDFGQTTNGIDPVILQKSQAALSLKLRELEDINQNLNKSTKPAKKKEAIKTDKNAPPKLRT